MKSNRAAAFALVFVLLAAASSPGEDAAGQLPEKLRAWADSAYGERYILRVDAPGEAGNIELNREFHYAKVLLPLKKLAPEQIEPLLLIGEDGNSQQLAWRDPPGDTGLEVIFHTRPGLRRFVLYAGAKTENPKRSGPLDVPNFKGGVRMRGRSAPFTFYEGGAFTLEKFQKLEEDRDAILGTRTVSNIDDPECPFMTVKADNSGHLQREFNPTRYAAVYEGFLRTPVSGKYAFALDTTGVGHVVIDGVKLISAEAADPRREPFALQAATTLAEGIHRVVVYYAEINESGRTNANLSRFGLRLHWQPPFAADFMIVPAQSFLSTMPALALKHENAEGQPLPFVHLEVLGHARSGAFRGISSAPQYSLMYFRLGDAPGEKLKLESSAGTTAADSASQTIFKWLPLGDNLRAIVERDGAEVLKREIHPPTIATGAADVIELEGRLAMKSAPDFIYPDEAAHLHLETEIVPLPQIIPKERMEVALLPPLPRPAGGFRLSFKIDEGIAGTNANQMDATPLEGLRRKLRVSMPVEGLETRARSGACRLALELSIGGIVVDELAFRILHSRSKEWPGRIAAAPAALEFIPGKDENKRENLIVVIPRENEADYRLFAPLKRPASPEKGEAALFLGDPLVEGDAANASTGLPGALAAAFNVYRWDSALVAGPHRYYPIYRMLAEAERYYIEQHGSARTVVISLGPGDASRQTPPYSFERAIDLLIDRLRVHGAQRIVCIGVLPEVSRLKNAKLYQERLNDLLRQHHLDGVDVLKSWQEDGNWERFYSIDGKENSSAYGPLPNADGIQNIVQLLQERL